MAIEEVLPWEEEIWRCPKHPSRRATGACPFCLRDRLLLLCPECARVPPCACSPSVSSSSSCLSSFSSIDLPRSGSVSGIGAIGRVSHLIENERAFQRSQSVAITSLRSRTVAAESGPSGRKGWAGTLWPFWRWTERAPPEKMGLGGSKGWVCNFPSPMKAFRHQKAARVLQESSLNEDKRRKRNS